MDTLAGSLAVSSDTAAARSSALGKASETTKMANTVMTNANMVVTREADPPGFFSNYASRTSFVLGGIQIGVGVLVVLFSVVVLASFGAYGVMSGIVGHLIFGVIVSSIYVCTYVTKFGARTNPQDRKRTPIACARSWVCRDNRKEVRRSDLGIILMSWFDALGYKPMSMSTSL